MKSILIQFRTTRCNYLATRCRHEPFIPYFVEYSQYDAFQWNRPFIASWLQRVVEHTIITGSIYVYLFHNKLYSTAKTEKQWYRTDKANSCYSGPKKRKNKMKVVTASTSK